MCYLVPTGSAIVTSFLWHKTKKVKLWWLNLMFCGGALFGLVDHLWNKELFLISKDIMKDLLLGVVISAVTFSCWLIILALAKKNPALLEINPSQAKS